MTKIEVGNYYIIIPLSLKINDYIFKQNEIIYIEKVENDKVLVMREKTNELIQVSKNGLSFAVERYYF